MAPRQVGWLGPGLERRRWHDGQSGDGRRAFSPPRGWEQDPHAGPRRLAGTGWSGLRQRGAVGPRTRLSAHRHRAGLRQRGERREGVARERCGAPGRVHHHQVLSRPQGRLGRSRKEPRAARRRPRRPVHRPLAGGRSHLGLAGNGTGPREGVHPFDWCLQLQRQRTRGAARRRRRPARGQSGAVQSIRVPARPAPGVRRSRYCR